MFLVLERPLEVLDASSNAKQNGGKATLQPGRHEIERISNPLGFTVPWLVLVGTKIGMTETCLNALVAEDETVKIVDE